MGLDITVYKGAAPVSGEVLEAVMSDSEPREAAYERGLDIPWINKDFPGREDVIQMVPYEHEESWSFRAGSYSGYNAWRASLAAMVGIRNLREFWTSPDMETPFAELLHFADNEGTIGPDTSAKLAKDFEDWHDRAVDFSKNVSDGGYWLDKYCDWERAFQDAAENGYVAFH